jgi:hypothetical protein
MTIEEFKETDPSTFGAGNINLLFSSSVVDPGIDNTPITPYVIQGLSIPYVSQEGTDLSTVLRQITEVRFPFVSSSLDAKIIGRQKRTNYYYFAIEDILVDELPTEVPSVGYVQEDTSLVFIPFSVDDFYNSDYNPTLNNSEGSKVNNVAVKVDRFTSQTIPTNLDAIINGTATPAELQNCSYTKIGLISSRYLGSKTTGAGSSYKRNKDEHTSYVSSNSIDGNVPALAYKQFIGSVHSIDANTTAIKNILQADRELINVYFNVDRINNAGTFEFPNFPYTSSYLYTEEGNKFIGLVNSKIYSVDKGEVFTSNEFGEVTLIE